MEKALELINSKKIYRSLFEKLGVKYKSHGKIGGKIKMKIKTEEDRKVLLQFNQMAIEKNEVMINAKDIERCFSRLLVDTSFFELLKFFLGEDLKTNKEIKEMEEKKFNKFLENIKKRSAGGEGKKWFLETMVNKKIEFGYRLIIQRYNSEGIFIQEDIIKIIEALNNLIPEKKEVISIYAAKISKDPHFLDENRWSGKLFYLGVRFLLNGKLEGKNIHELYYEAGIIKNEILNSTTIYNLQGYKEFKKILAIKEYINWKEPLQLSLKNISKIDYFKAIKDSIYVFENTAVFQEIAEKIGEEISLICTSGQINFSSYCILDSIKDLKTIYYAGDFDPEGLLIAQKLKSKYGEKVQFLLYDEADYKESISNVKLSKERIQKLEGISEVGLEKISKCLIKYQSSGYQELLIDKYIEEIKKIIELE